MPENTFNIYLAGQKCLLINGWVSKKLTKENIHNQEMSHEF
jgi:hypothetical protein